MAQGYHPVALSELKCDKVLNTLVWQGFLRVSYRSVAWRQANSGTKHILKTLNQCCPYINNIKSLQSVLLLAGY